MALERKPLPIAAVPRRRRASAARPAPGVGALIEKSPNAGGAATAPATDGGSDRGGRGGGRAEPAPAPGAPIPDGHGQGHGAGGGGATPGLRIERANDGDGGDDGVSPWLAAGAVAVALGAVALFRRRLIPRRLRRRGQAT